MNRCVIKINCDVLSADLGNRHTGCCDAAMHLEIVLAMQWWWRACKGDKSIDELLIKASPDGSGGREAVVNGVTALRLRYESLIKEFDARVSASAFANRMLPRRQAGNCAQGAATQMDLVQLLRRDPTGRSYKSMLRCKGYNTLINWAKHDDSDPFAGAVGNVQSMVEYCSKLHCFCHASLATC